MAGYMVRGRLRFFLRFFCVFFVAMPPYGAKLEIGYGKATPARIGPSKKADVGAKQEKKNTPAEEKLRVPPS